MRRGDVDSSKRYFRSETRLFNLNGSWYFATREEDQGPFPRRELAETEALRYANERMTLCGFQESREVDHAVRKDAGGDLSILPLDESVPRRGILELEVD